MENISLNYERVLRFLKIAFLIVAVAALTPATFAMTDAESEKLCEEILKTLTTISFDSVFENSERHQALHELSTIYKQRAPHYQKIVDDGLTEDHARKEMSFQVRNPETGFYDKFVAVPVNGHVAPVLKKDFDRMVKSTGPVLKSLRELLQKAYSQKNWTAESLGLSQLPEKEAAIVLKVLRESIYMEPAMISGEMAAYPFLAVSGFDGAIVDPAKPQNVFFEMNLGTPSGLANNKEMLDSLLEADRDVSRVLKPYLPRDNTFTLLREAIELSAREWTKSEGISVVISPGIYNGAHPDVAAIAKHTGMPLVKSSDLYEDAGGSIRLRTAGGGEDPVVTGIYNRMEESFFLQSTDEKIPLISPQYADLSALANKTGLRLRPGAIYRWTYGPDGAIDGVERGKHGEPLLEDVWDKIGADPARPTAARGSIARAVKSRKLYVSNIGGRLVDDKRLFRIVSQYLAKGSVRGGVASPVASLKPDKLKPLFKNPDDFVVKAPANSGGAGIFFLRNLDAGAKAALLQQVKQNPGDYEIQYVSPIATLPMANETNTVDVAIDLRLFVMMKPDGSVNAGPNSILLRTAPPGGLFSNTSRGGGYGIGVVLENKIGRFKGLRDWLDSAGERPYPHSRMIASEVENGIAALTGLKDLWKAVDTAADIGLFPEDLTSLKERALHLSFDLRGLLHLLPGDTAALPSRLRDFSQNPENELKSLLMLSRVIESAFDSLRGTNGALATALREVMNEDRDWWDHLGRRRQDPTSHRYHELNHKISYRKLEEPVVAYYWEKLTERREKYEMAEIVAVQDPVLQNMIDFVKENGGQVRLMKNRILTGTDRKVFAGWGFESPYFWVNLDPTSKSYLIPVIGIDLLRDRAIAALAHEMEHFKIWLENYHLQLEAGLDREAAAKAAVAHVWQQDMIVYGERRAVEAEMQAERDYPHSEFNKAKHLHRPRDLWEKGYVNRLLYPEFEAVRQVLHRHVNMHQDLDRETLHKYMTVIVQRTLEMREEALAHLEQQELSDSALGDYWRRSSVSQLVTKPYGIERLMEQRTLHLFNLYLDEICKEITGGTVTCH